MSDMLEPRKKRILILGCGGTIACVLRGNALVPAKTIAQIVRAVPGLTKHADVALRQMEQRDSTDLTPHHWSVFAQAIADAVEGGQYDGIIVTHGTDTMAYSATAVALFLGPTLTIPVVFTGSQLSLVEFGTDARFNLENAMKTVLEASRRRIAEVMIVFNDSVLRAARSIKASEAGFAAFTSPAFPPLGIISAVGVHFTPLARRIQEGMVFVPSRITKNFSRGILVLDLVPGLEPDIVFDIIRGGRCRGLILRSLGAGNVPSLDEYSLIPCIVEATQIGIPVVITTKFIGGTTRSNIYAPGQKALAAGAIESGDLTDVATQVKLMWLLAGKVPNNKIREGLLTDVVGEVSTPER